MRTRHLAALGAAAFLVHAACTRGAGDEAPNRASSAPPGIQPALRRAPFGRTADGQPVEIFTLTNGAGLEVRTMSYGATIVSLRVPDRDGRAADVVLGFDTFDEYVTKKPPYFGAVVGRYGNRIAKGRFTLDGRTYTLATNNGPNHLHGGVRGFDKVVWSAAPFEREGTVGVVYSYTSRDGEEGYPGTLKAQVTYTIGAGRALTVDYEAETDKATPVNLTQHSYFNLAGEGSGDILGHRLTIHASRFTPVDATLIPTGVLAPVAGTPFDFTSPHAIGDRIAADDPQLKNGNGYDHNWVIDRDAPGLEPAAHLADPSSGRTLDVSTTEPGVQFYSGNFLDGTIAGKAGHVYGRRSGLCLETQHFPDSPNHDGFPSTIVRPGTPYSSKTVFAFGVAQ
ncbi:MAG TPA: aldose epimerase family protein [Vicinamibacterales bacterium]|nr:aldose epimerase family protein [Vicinamibacterales bacterium]